MRAADHPTRPDPRREPDEAEGQPELRAAVAEYTRTTGDALNGMAEAAAALQKTARAARRRISNGTIIAVIDPTQKIPTFK